MNRIRSCFVTVISIFAVICIAILLITLFNSGSGGLFGPRNLLFLGLDEREDSNEFVGRTDTIMIFHVSGGEESNALISIPRDTRVNLKDEGWNKINAAYVYGGADMTKDEIRQLTGIDIDGTMVLNFNGFKRVIDMLGGVYITVDEPLHDPLSGADFDPGEYLMDGEMALAFARCRSTARADLDRVDRQQYLINEVMKQKLNASSITKIINPFNSSSNIFTVLNQETRSDFTIWDFCSIGFVLLFSNKDIERLTIPVTGETIDGISYLIADEDEVKEFLSDYTK